MSGEIRADGKGRGDKIASPTDLPTSHEAQEERPSVSSFDTVVFCGDAEQVRVGFKLALGVLEARDDLLLME
ncbi:hypothetical protein [Bradyrhizobium diazoefficiens]|uniref:hypothetical protein n=1 Tax=Bradyrhizobium diazoefficiens TaxID=1355477 RepID=UPI0034776C7F